MILQLTIRDFATIALMQDFKLVYIFLKGRILSLAAKVRLPDGIEVNFNLLIVKPASAVNGQKAHR